MDGKPLQSFTPASQVSLGFTGHRHDDDLDLIDMNGRVYDPLQRRFLTPDPLVSSPFDGQSYNRYAYVRNNPLRYTDPSGFQSTEAPAEQDAADGSVQKKPPIVIPVVIVVERPKEPQTPAVPSTDGGGQAPATGANAAPAPQKPHVDDQPFGPPLPPGWDENEVIGPPVVLPLRADGGPGLRAVSATESRTWRNENLLWWDVPPDDLTRDESAALGIEYDIVYAFKHGIYVPIRDWIKDEPKVYLDSDHDVRVSTLPRDHTDAIPALAQLGAMLLPAPGGSTRITSGSQVTEQVIRDAMEGAPLKSQQAGGVSLPRVQQYVDRLLAGEAAPAIKVDGRMIVDGNHRYIAGRILGQEPPTQPWAGGRPGSAVPWESIPIDPEAW